MYFPGNYTLCCIYPENINSGIYHGRISITGFQALLFAMWMDKQNNLRLYR